MNIVANVLQIIIAEERKESSTELSPYSYAVFYLDVHEGKHKQHLKMAIFQLGGSMSHFLSKDVTHVISNRATGHREGSNKTKPQVFLEIILELQWSWLWQWNL